MLAPKSNEGLGRVVTRPGDQEDEPTGFTSTKDMACADPAKVTTDNKGSENYPHPESWDAKHGVSRVDAYGNDAGITSPEA